MSQEFELALDYLETYTKVSRQQKLHSCKHNQQNGKHDTNSNSNTARNKVQKYNQSRKTALRKHIEQETMQKVDCDSKDRQYYCSVCMKTFSQPCRCNWVGWCGNEDSTWDKCYYGCDDLCAWHVREYYRQ
jgi:hypothetical protein